MIIFYLCYDFCCSLYLVVFDLSLFLLNPAFRLLAKYSPPPPPSTETQQRLRSHKRAVSGHFFGVARQINEALANDRSPRQAVPIKRKQATHNNETTPDEEDNNTPSEDEEDNTDAELERMQELIINAAISTTITTPRLAEDTTTSSAVKDVESISASDESVEEMEQDNKDTTPLTTVEERDVLRFLEDLEIPDVLPQ